MTSPLLEGLNAEQQAAVLATDGPVLVVAGPGSGKTRVLTHRIAYVIQELGASPDEILAVTFTNKAAREMRERIDHLLGSSGATTGLWMGTFHSMGVRILRAHPGVVADRLGILPNFLIYDDADQIGVAKQAITAIGQDPKKVAPRRMLSRISAAKSQLFTPHEFRESEIQTYDDEIVARVFEEYERLLRRNNALDFDDLLSQPIRLFDAAANVLDHYQSKFRYILVDEYQDTNRVQYVMVSALAGKHRNLFVVGDPDQSIYAWRQADIRNILDFERDYPDARRIDLEINYRSTARIVAAADNVIKANTQRLDRKLRTINDEGAPISVRELTDQNHEARFIVDEIRRLVVSGYRVGDIAVMYRTTAQSRVLEEAFRQSDVRYRIVGGVRFYERAEVKNALAAMRLLYNPADQVSLQRVLDTMPIGRGLGPKALEAIEGWARPLGLPLLDGFMALNTPDSEYGSPPLSGATRSAAARFGEAFTNLRKQMMELPLLDLFDAVMEESGYASSFRQDIEEDMDRQANVLELRSDIARYNELAPGAGLAAYLEQVALIADVDSMDRDRSEACTLITLHSAKGLEYPVVFIAGVEEGLLPISRAIEAEYDDPSQVEEERRLFYVGITRAETLLYLTYTGMRMSYGRLDSTVPSRFLDALPQEHVKVLAARLTLAASGTGRLLDRARTTTRSFSSPVAAPVRVSPIVPTYTVGQRVFHAQFGEGTVSEVVARNSDQEVAVDFARHGRKRLLASIAPLDLVD
jgi:DNA helicase-2/ATP-dependent DNA helicase PcrA